MHLVHTKMNKKRIVVVCPGRGSYSRDTSNYLKDIDSSLVSMIEDQDQLRVSKKLKGILELDKSSFRSKVHMTGENASPLIYSCSLKDYDAINKDKYDIVAICGNSMGWYITLALGGAISYKDGFELIQTMGGITQHHGKGGQIIYPIVDEQWRIDNDRKEMVLQEISKVGAKISIHLGGYIVIAGEQNQLDHLLNTLPAIDKYPFQIPFHSAFHTDLLSGVPSLAHSSLDDKIFNRPNIPIVDGKGNIWSPWSTDKKELYNYTLNDQITSTYDFSKSISVSLKEFCPDHIVLLGPGNSLGAPVAQVLINHNWNELKTKTDFLNSQGSNPYIISMGLEEQKKLVL